MDAERWKKIEDIFQDALDLSGEARRNFIDEKAGDDSELRAEVEKLVARFETEDEFLESPVWTDSVILGNTLKNRVASSLENEILPESSEKSFTGKRVGVYRLTDQIGKGGMGVVYAAERADGEFRQKVAVKLIKRGMDTDFIIRRFRHERQILANLNHPNIARLLDGGTTDDGLPYFVMEFIEGEPLLKYSEEKNLDLRQKLKLFLQVCAPIIYAHRRKIIHRDIKPSNIMVNEDGEPKLLDFGIAKLLDTDSIHDSLLPTATAMRLMTPEYASPEQVRGEEITPASDQYSLGVLLYELITGARPYKFPSRSAHEIARVICEEIPSEPSSENFEKSAISEIDVDFDEKSGKNLDRIVLKSLRKIPSERYASVEDFAADIESFLRNENVRAESFATEKNKLETSFEIGKAQDTKDFEKTTNENVVGEKIRNISREKAISPRWRGIKQGIFISVLSIVSIPLFVLITATAILPPQISITAFVLFFLSGFARMIYALLFESGKKEDNFSLQTENETTEAETKLINSLPPRETVVGSRSAFEKTVETEKIIAVLPFRYLNTLSGENTGGSDFLSVGLADSLITRISNVRQFIVRPTSSVLKFGATETDSVEAGKELNVGFVVEGNIVKTEKRIRVSVQLLDVEKRSTVWAERFEENFTDVLEIEDSISAKVVESLIPHLSGEQRRQIEKRGTNNAEAHEAFLRGRAVWNTFTEEGLQKSLAFFNRAIELDPNYAVAHAAIADYYVWLGMYCLLPVEEFYPIAKNSALRAIELDPKSSEAYAALGLTELYGKFDWETSEKYMRRAIEINPNNPVAHLWLTHNLYTRGKFEEGRRELDIALELDPLSFQNHNTYAWGLYFERLLPEAIAKTDELIEKFPNASHSYFAKSAFLRFVGRTQESLEISVRALEFSQDNLFIYYGYAAALAADGKHQKALEIIENRPPSAYLSDYHTAIVYGWLKENDKAFEMLDKAIAAHESTLIWLAVEPSLDYLRQDSRFEKALEKIKHPLAAKADFAPKQLPNESRNNLQIEKKKTGKISAIKYIFPAIIAIVFGLGIYNFLTNLKFDFSNTPPEKRWKTAFASTMRAERLTASGTAIVSAISPDGAQIAFALREGENQSLWIKSTAASDNPARLVAPSEENYVGITFSPDGKSVYYDNFSVANNAWRLSRVATSGGEPQMIAENIYRNVCFAPDGRRIAYYNLDPKTRSVNLLVGEMSDDGKIEAQKTLANYTLPDHPVGNPAFSPDGKKIVYGATRIEDGAKENTNLFVFDLESGASERLGEQSFNEITAIAWREYEEEIVVSANLKNTEPLQLWLSSYPSGELSRLTNDLNNYVGVSISRDSSAITASKKNVTSNISTVDLNNLKGIDEETNSKQITTGFERQDGINGIEWTADGRILYVAGTEKKIVAINADGGGNRTFDLGDVTPASPVLTADGKFLFFIDQKGQEATMQRYETATGAIAQITSGLTITPALTPDGKFVVYSAINDALKTSLHRIPVEGGKAVELTSASILRPEISPDGRFIACFYNSESLGGQWQIAVLGSNGGVPLRILEPNGLVNLRTAHERPLAWSSDNRFVYYLNDKGGVSNIFRVAADASNRTEPLTHFKSGSIFNFAVAPDGKSLALARGSTSTDIVIFKNSQ